MSMFTKLENWAASNHPITAVFWKWYYSTASATCKFTLVSCVGCVTIYAFTRRFFDKICKRVEHKFSGLVEAWGRSGTVQSICCLQASRTVLAVRLARPLLPPIKWHAVAQSFHSETGMYLSIEITGSDFTQNIRCISFSSCRIFASKVKLWSAVMAANFCTANHGGGEQIHDKLCKRAWASESTSWETHLDHF